MKSIEKAIFLLVGIFILSTFSFSLSCLALAGGYDLNAVKEQTYYFDFTVYNTDADPNTICDSGVYDITLSINGADIDELFDYSLTETKLALNDSEVKKIMVSLTPKIDSGFYEVLVTVQRSDTSESSGTKIFNSTVGKIKVDLGGEAKKTSYDEVPEWYEQEQKADLNTQNYQKDNNTQEDKDIKAGAEGGSNVLLYVIICLLVVIIIILGYFALRKK